MLSGKSVLCHRHAVDMVTPITTAGGGHKCVSAPHLTRQGAFPGPKRAIAASWGRLRHPVQPGPVLPLRGARHGQRAGSRTHVRTMKTGLESWQSVGGHVDGHYLT